MPPHITVNAIIVIDLSEFSLLCSSNLYVIRYFPSLETSFTDATDQMLNSLTENERDFVDNDSIFND